jgi:hypothetical protein
VKVRRLCYGVLGLIGDIEMNYDDQIEALQNKQQELEDEILNLMELRAAGEADLKGGDKVLIIHSDAVAEVISCKASAFSDHGDRFVEIRVLCQTHSGRKHELQRREVKKL